MRLGLDVGLPSERDLRIDFPAAGSTPRGMQFGLVQEMVRVEKACSLEATGIEN
jgi:hypothetical protein